MSTSTARPMKGSRRLERRHDRRSPSPQWQFLRGFLKHPVMVGSIIPSSRVLIDKMLGPVDWANTRLFVEYGPGVGTFTRHVLDRLGPDLGLGRQEPLGEAEPSKLVAKVAPHQDVALLPRGDVLGHQPHHVVDEVEPDPDVLLPSGVVAPVVPAHQVVTVVIGQNADHVGVQVGPGGERLVRALEEIAG